MKKIFFYMWLLFLAVLILDAEEIEARFDVSYGVFGKIGVADAVLHKGSTDYTIEIKLHATGLAKLLSRNRKERHISKGHFEDGLMVSDRYEVHKSYGHTRTQKVYMVDHHKRKVRKVFEKFKKGKLVQKEDFFLDFYSKDDLLTLYFNLDSAIVDKYQPKTYRFQAIGAENQGGMVSVVVPSKEETANYQKLLGSDAVWYATAVIHQKIFSSKEGRLMLAVGKDGITNMALLKDVIFFGDIRAKRLKEVQR